MPPKKKGVAAAKVSKEESVKDTLIEPGTSSLELKKIPKKPFFRSIDFDNLSRIKHIRVKLWKIHSYSKTHHVSCFEMNQRKEEERNKKFMNTFKSLTMKKSLKRVKRIKFHPSSFTKERFIKRLCSTWRLDSLVVSVPEKFENYGFLKPLLNSTLRN